MSYRQRQEGIPSTAKPWRLRRPGGPSGGKCDWRISAFDRAFYSPFRVAFAFVGVTGLRLFRNCGLVIILSTKRLKRKAFAVNLDCIRSMAGSSESWSERPSEYASN